MTVPARKQVLTAADERRLAAADRRIEKAEAQVASARREWAGIVRRIGLSGVARFYEVSPQAIQMRLKAAERAN